VREAREVCGRCPVREDCLQLALDENERRGIWGGLTDHERRALKRQQQEEVA
jgi:WhiB family redox-sensing transcriptional regulator